MDTAIVFLIQCLSSIGTLVLISLGLGIVYGMMKVINLAHGEFLMLGGYTAVTAANAGVNVWVSIIVLPPLVVGAIGLIVERLIMRHLYGRMIDTMLATWGLSLTFIGLVTVIFGNTVSGISSPLPSVVLGTYRMAGYDLLLIAVGAVLSGVCFLVMRFTPAGLIARATMNNAEMSAALAINTSRVYSMTFAVGAAVTGLAGGLIAPISGVIPSIGAAYLANAFITVISGGAAFLSGTLSAASIFGIGGATFRQIADPSVAEIAILFIALTMLRLLPKGITGRFPGLSL